MPTPPAEHAKVSFEGVAALGCLLTGRPSREDLPWDFVVSLARQHDLTPFLYWRLTRGPEGAVAPAEVPQEITEDFYFAIRQTTRAERQLAELLAALSQAQVPAIVLKGATTGAFYPNPALRVYSDLDFLVPGSQILDAERALQALGYRATQPKSWWQEHFQHLPPMTRRRGERCVEVHWGLGEDGNAGCLPAQDVWERCVPWRVGPGAGQPALRLDDVDMVLHLCYHAAVQHRLYEGLRPLCDLAQVVDGWDQAQWSILMGRAQAYGLQRALDLVLALAARWLSLELPPEVTERWETLAPVLDDLLMRLAFPKAGGPAALVGAGAKSGLGPRLRYLVWHVFLPRDGMATTYGIPARSPLIWLAYAWRPFDLLRKHGGTMWRLLRAEETARSAWTAEVWLDRWLQGPGNGEQDGDSRACGSARTF